MWPWADGTIESDAPAGPRPRRLSLWSVAMLAAGYFAAREHPEIASTLWLGAAAAFTLLALFLRDWPCRIALALAVTLGGGGWFAARINERPADSLWWRLHHDPLSEPPVLRITAMVETTPRDEPVIADRWPAPDRARATVFDVAVRSIEVDGRDEHATGRLRVRIDGPAARLDGRGVRAGSLFRITGRLLPVRPPLNPGEPPRDLLAAQDHRVGTVVVTSPALLNSVVPRDWLDHLLGPWLAARAALRDATHAALGPADAGEHARGRSLARAMLLGERDPALSDVESAFKRVGLVHIVAISGFNLAVLVFVTLLVVRLTGDRGWLEPAIAAAVVGLYMLALPGEPSIRRAGFTLLAFMLAEAAGRRYDRLTMLGWVAFALLLARPMDLWSLGFQLSFGIVAALLWLGRRVHERLWGIRIRGLVATPRQRTSWYGAGSWTLEAIKSQISATLLAWAVAAPLIAHHTGAFSPLAPLASLAVLPIAMILLITGYAALLLGLVIPPAAEGASVLLATLGEAAVWVVTNLDEAPGAALHLPSLGVAWTFTATICAIYWLGWAWLKDWRGWSLALVTSAWLALIIFNAGRLPHGTLLRLDALAMGEGECLILRSGGDALLVNCGSGSAARPSAEDITRAARDLGAWRTPTVLLTDARPESWTALPNLLEPLGVKTVLLPEGLENATMLEPTGSHAHLLDQLDALGIRVRVVGPGDRFSLGPAVVELLSGGRDALVPRITAATEAGPRSMVLGGSASLPDLLAALGDGRPADALVLPRRARNRDRPGEAVLAASAQVVIASGGPRTVRPALERLGDQRSIIRAPAITGHAAVEIDRRGEMRTRP